MILHFEQNTIKDDKIEKKAGKFVPKWFNKRVRSVILIGSLHRVKKKNLENQSYSYFEDRVLERKGSIKLIIDCMLNISQTNTDSTATNEYLIAHIMTPVGSRQIQCRSRSCESSSDECARILTRV